VKGVVRAPAAEATSAAATGAVRTPALPPPLRRPAPAADGAAEAVAPAAAAHLQINRQNL